MSRVSTQTRIIKALRDSGRALSDRDVSALTGIPEPSVRRTRLHLQAAGTVVRDGAGYRVREPWEHPNRYEGEQELSWRLSE